jgi:predicted dehydrogenase
MRAAALGIAIVGCGAIGLRRATVAAAHPGSCVVAVADTDETRARQVADATGAATGAWQAVVERPDVDAVVVATPHDALAPVSIRALEAGKHVLCEKPMARSAQEAERVVAAAQRARRSLMVGFNHRHHPAVEQAHAMAAAGEIGDLLFIRCRYGHGGRPGYEREWRMDPARSGGGELLDQGIHAIDLFRWFLGELTEVSGMVANWVWTAPVEDNVFALFRSPKGQVASLHASWTQWKNVFSFEVVGRRGALLVEGLGKSYGVERLVVQRRRDQGGAPDEEVIEFPGPDTSWEAEWDGFLTAVGSERPDPADGADALAALRLVEAVYEAARRGATVDLS